MNSLNFNQNAAYALSSVKANKTVKTPLSRLTQEISFVSEREKEKPSPAHCVSYAVGSGLELSPHATTTPVVNLTLQFKPESIIQGLSTVWYLQCNRDLFEKKKAFRANETVVVVLVGARERERDI